MSSFSIDGESRSKSAQLISIRSTFSDTRRQRKVHNHQNRGTNTNLFVETLYNSVVDLFSLHFSCIYAVKLKFWLHQNKCVCLLTHQQVCCFNTVFVFVVFSLSLFFRWLFVCFFGRRPCADKNVYSRILAVPSPSFISLLTHLFAVFLCQIETNTHFICDSQCDNVKLCCKTLFMKKPRISGWFI